MPTFEERFEVQAPAGAVWDFLLDPARLAPCIPGCSNLEVIDDRTYRLDLTVKVGFLSTTQRVVVKVLQADPPRRLVAEGRGEDARLGSHVELRSTLELEPAGPGATAVQYRSDVKVLGRLGSVGDAVMRATAGTLARRFAGQVRSAIEGAA